MNFLGCCGSLNVGSVLAWLLDQGVADCVCAGDGVGSGVGAGVGCGGVGVGQLG